MAGQGGDMHRDMLPTLIKAIERGTYRTEEGTGEGMQNPRALAVGVSTGSPTLQGVKGTLKA